MVEQEPEGFKRKHDTAISLDQYSGIASDIMEVNDPVSDRFMAVGDVRRDIVILSKPENRTTEYDSLGEVKVGRQLGLPNWKDLTKRPADMDVVADSDAWYIRIDDQALSRKSLEKVTPKKKFDEVFTGEFQDEVNAGIKKILLKEKLRNAGNFNYTTLSAYLLTALDLQDIIEHIPQGLAATTAAVARKIPFIAFHNAFISLYTNRPSKLFGDHDDPFVRRSIPDLFFPNIPVDRLARGLFYLGRHGKEIIETE